MRVLGLAGSPRRGGNTDILLAEVLCGAAEAGAETKTVVLSGLSIAGCRHCDACAVSGRCVISDDMDGVYKEIAEADRLVLASPLHFSAFTAQMKLAVDRCQVYWARKYRLKIPPLEPLRERRGILISVGGQPKADLSVFDPIIASVKNLFLSLNVKYAGAVLFPGVDEKGDILKHEGALETAYRAGKKLVTG